MIQIIKPQEFSHKQRYQISTGPQNKVYAALTLGPAGMVMHIDYTVFEKTMAEKMKLYTFKRQLGKTKNHKFVSQFHGSF